MHVGDRLPTRRCLSKSSAEANDAYGAREATVRLTVIQVWLSPSDRKRAAVVKLFQVLRGRLPATARKLEVVKVRCNVLRVAPTKKIANLTRLKYFFMYIRICNVNEYYLSTLSVNRLSDSQFAFEVKDTGIGIPSHARDYIFEEFRQVDGSSKRQFGGTGLGLAIVQKLARAMGGTVAVQSELGNGSAFTVTLPLQKTIVQQGIIA